MGECFDDEIYVLECRFDGLLKCCEGLVGAGGRSDGWHHVRFLERNGGWLTQQTNSDPTHMQTIRTL